MSFLERINRIHSMFYAAMPADVQIVSEKLKNISKKLDGRTPDKKMLMQVDALERRIKKSVNDRIHRQSRLPDVSIPSNLPIFVKRQEIIDTIVNNQVVIIAGDTGSGKSTQIPKMCLEAGRGITGKVGCTQPRRIAAVTIAGRIAEELGEEIGLSVGYKIRFQDNIKKSAYIKVMTDGILLAETQSSPYLDEYDTIIIDEAHERSLNIDFLLGILKALLLKRKDLKLIITSATIDTLKFSAAFNNAPVIEVSGRVFPVEVVYMPIDPRLEDTGEVTYVDQSVKAVEKLVREKCLGDILIFMPTESDILETCDLINARQFYNVTVLPLFARLSGSQQAQVFKLASGQKIVVSTNVAETSLTIPGIKYVIDTGLARVSQYLPRTRIMSLPISPISKSSAEQRKGRCGRLENGICIRLYSEEDLLKRQEYTPPEILRSNLAEVILRMLNLNLKNINSFPFIDKPHPGSIKDGFDLLVELGAIRKTGQSVFLTKRGKLMARMPIDPRISRMLLEAAQRGCLDEVSVIASALSIQDPRERPSENSIQADQMHAPFKDPSSDFITLYNMWNYYHGSLELLKSQNNMRKFCKKHYLSYSRMREWRHIHGQITKILADQKVDSYISSPEISAKSRYENIHKSILSGYLSGIACKKDKNSYLAARNREVFVFPGSTLFKKKSEWIVASEIVKTSKLYARTVAAIQCEWLEELGGDLCKKTYSSPHWNKKRGEVCAYEQVSLFGLVIVARRAVSYGLIDPDESSRIFIQAALVEGDIQGKFGFLEHNNDLILKISEIEDKTRRRDILVSEAELAEFYLKRLEGVYDISSLKKLIKDRGGDDFLKMREQEVLLLATNEIELDNYPEKIKFGNKLFKCSYKFAPGKSEDGVTISVPSTHVSEIPSNELDWIVPGLFKEKITAIIKGLPKGYRKKLIPVPETVDIIVAGLKKQDESFISSLSKFVYKKFDVDIPAMIWESVRISDHLKMRISIIDHEGSELESGRDANILKKNIKPQLSKSEIFLYESLRNKWEKLNITKWDFGDLPEFINIDTKLTVYPGLEPVDSSVSIKLFGNLYQAIESHEKGVEMLFCRHLDNRLKLLKKDLVFPKDKAPGVEYFGGPNRFGEMVYNSLVRNLFRRNIRTEEGFYSHAEASVPLLFSRGRDLKELFLKILECYFNTRSKIHDIEKTNNINPNVLKLCFTIRQHMALLMPDNFVEITNVDRLVHFPRYFKAMSIRADRGMGDYNKDCIKAEQVCVFEKHLEKLLTDTPLHIQSVEKKMSIEEYRWMIEEFKVSVFAQELKTVIPVSKKRLENMGKEIERLI